MWFHKLLSQPCIACPTGFHLGLNALRFKNVLDQKLWSSYYYDTLNIWIIYYSNNYMVSLGSLLYAGINQESIVLNVTFVFT